MFSDERLWDSVSLCASDAMDHHRLAAALIGYRLPQGVPANLSYKEDLL